MNKKQQGTVEFGVNLPSGTLVLSVELYLRKDWRCLTQNAGFAQTGDRLSVVPAGKDGGSARAGNALSVRCWLFDRVQESGSDLVVGCGVGGATPDRKSTPNIQRGCI